MNVVIVNGKRYETNGGSISIVGNKVYCNGVEITDFNGIQEKNVNITIEGNVEGNVETSSGNITVKGNCHSIETTSGDVECGDVAGGVKTVSGDVKAKKILGNVKTVSGDISKSFL